MAHAYQDILVKIQTLSNEKQYESLKSSQFPTAMLKD